MKPQKVIFDTCTFNNFISQIELYKNMGAKSYQSMISVSTKYLNNQKQEILDLMHDEFKKNNSHLLFGEQLTGYKFYLKMLIQDIKYQISKYRGLYHGVLRKDGQKIKFIPTEDQKKQFLKQIELLQQKIEQVIQHKEKFKALSKEYKNNVSFIRGAKLFAKYMNGEFQLCLTSTGLKEVKAYLHIQKKTKNHVKYNAILEVLKKTIYISTKPSVVAKVEDLARQYRTSLGIKGLSPMEDDINAMGDYGDSKIMAEANLSGIILITENAKDFIKDDFGGVNQRKRKHIKRVNIINKQYTTDACAYSLEEFLAGRFTEPQIESKFLKPYISEADAIDYKEIKTLAD